MEPLVEPSVVIGHEEDNPLNNTGMPAFGWVTGLRRKGRKLFADIVNVFPAIAKLIRAKAYKHVSPEIYDPDKLPEGVPAKGHMLRRLALLGGQLPHIKSLADLPEPFPDGKGEKLTDVEIFEAGHWQGTNYKLSDLDDMVRNFEQFSQPVRQFTELTCFKAPRVRLTASRRLWQDSSRAWLCFSEVTAMADDAVQQVAEAAIMQSFPGLPQEFVASLTPDQMSMLAPAIAPPSTDAGATSMQDTPERGQMIADLVALGEDPAALEAMTDADLQTLWQQKKGTTMSEPIASTAVTPPPVVPVREPEPRQPQQITTTQKFSEERLTLLEKRLEAAEREQRRRDRLDRLAEAQKKKSAVRAFCEQLSKSGKASPAEVEFDKTTGEPLGALAFALSAASSVRKFSEGGTETKSDLEVLMEKLEARKARQFSEQVADPVKDNAGGSLSPERREQLLKLTGRGRSVLAKEGAKKQEARMFAETLASVLHGKLSAQ